MSLHKIYLMRASNYAKVGITSGVIEKRMAAIQTGCPISIHLVQYWSVKTRNIALLIEKEIHSKMQNRRTHGEWFKNVSDTANDIRYVLSLYGIAFNDHNTIHNGKKIVLSRESDDILKSINRCIENNDIDRLIKVGKRIDVMNEKKAYDSLCDTFKKSLNKLLENEEFRIKKENK